MSLKRSTLKAMGLNEEQIETIIADHLETVDSLKAENKGLEEKVAGLGNTTAELETVRKELNALKQNGSDAAKVQAEFDAYRKQIADEKANAQKTAAVRSLLRSSGVVSDSVAALLMDKVDLNTVEMDGESVKNADTLVGGIKERYGDCFAVQKDVGLSGSTPPSGGTRDTDNLSDEEYYRRKFGGGTN